MKQKVLFTHVLVAMLTAICGAAFAQETLTLQQNMAAQIKQHAKPGKHRVLAVNLLQLGTYRHCRGITLHEGRVGNS